MFVVRFIILFLLMCSQAHASTRLSSISNRIVASRYKVNKNTVYCYFKENSAEAGIISNKRNINYWTPLKVWQKSLRVTGKKKNQINNQIKVATRNCSNLFLQCETSQCSTSCPNKCGARPPPEPSPTPTITPTATPTPTPWVSPSSECNEETQFSDALSLLNESDGLNITISQKSNGTKTFTASLGDRNLRQSAQSERFFVVPTSGLNITYDITRKCGGVDISYNITNPSSITEYTLPDLMVEGLVFDQSQEMQRLKSKDYGNLVTINQNQTSWEDGSYPQVYSPVQVVTDNDYSIGSALLFPVLEHKQSVLPKLEKITNGELAGTFRHRFAEPRVEGYPVSAQPPKKLQPLQTTQYTITVRFATKRYWLATLAPYKKYFDSLYQTSKIYRQADLHPIRGVMLADSSYYDATSNPRSFVSSLHIHDQGWSNFAPSFSSSSKTLGYKRTMLWLPSGRYSGGLNFPPQFMDFTPQMEATVSAFSSFAQKNVNLGFWWGRSSQIPVFGNSDSSWNPVDLTNADPENPEHVSFLTTQLSKSIALGTKDIGLDYFVATPLSKRFEWAKTLRELAPDVVFAGEGQQPDVMHSRIANFHDPYTFLGELPQAPDLLSKYLNPNQETWLYIFSSSQLAQVDRAAVQKFISWGYTPMLMYLHNGTNVEGLTLTVSECLDGLDNNNDGFVDFPFDPNCADQFDNSEVDAQSSN